MYDVDVSQKKNEHDNRVSRVHSGLHCDDRDVFLSYVLRADPTVQSTARMMIAAVAYAQWVAL